jgi:hypothetical protein
LTSLDVHDEMTDAPAAAAISSQKEFGQRMARPVDSENQAFLIW